MTTYSAFFSSGLLAPCITRPSTPPLHTLPVPPSPIDRELSITPTPLSPTTPQAKASRAGAAPGERPRALRRRRSSMNVAAGPMAVIKSPSRNVTNALHRTGVMSPSRSRASSINEASENNSLFGRLRSGSLSMMPSMRTRRTIRRPVPIAPPPTIPLPAVPPPSPSPKCTNTMLLPALVVPVPRQPLSTRASPIDNAGTLFSSALASPTLLSPTLLSPDYAPKFPTRMLPSRASSPAIPIPEQMDYFENMADVEMNDN
ncbi:hypothetical protein V8B97DRAFT_2010203 [Scleroderma yunnanense]